MRKLTILVDLDDTLTNLSETWVRVLNERHGLSAKHSDISEWDIGLIFPTLTKEQVIQPLLEDDFWDLVTPLPGSAEYLGKIINDGHLIYIVTASYYTTLKAKMDKVLFKYYPFLSWDNVIVTSNKQMVRGDILIDDGIHNHIGGDYHNVLMDAPHNKRYDAETNGFIRVHSWREVYREVNRLAKEKCPYIDDPLQYCCECVNLREAQGSISCKKVGYADFCPVTEIERGEHNRSKKRNSKNRSHKYL